RRPASPRTSSSRVVLSPCSRATASRPPRASRAGWEVSCMLEGWVVTAGCALLSRLWLGNWLCVPPLEQGFRRGSWGSRKLYVQVVAGLELGLVVSDGLAGRGGAMRGAR